MIERILYHMIACVRRYLVAKSVYNIQVNTWYISLYVDTDVRNMIEMGGRDNNVQCGEHY